MTLSADQRERRSASQKKYYHNTANRAKDLARGAVSDALRRGDLVCPLSCAGCGEATKLEAHHEDYSKPLEVQWLCRGCHSARHWKTHCVHGHEYTEENTYVRPDGKRSCRICKTASMRKHHSNLRQLRTQDSAGTKGE